MALSVREGRLRVLEVEVVLQHEAVLVPEGKDLVHRLGRGLGVVVCEEPFGADEVPVGHDLWGQLGVGGFRGAGPRGSIWAAALGVGAVDATSAGEASAAGSDGLSGGGEAAVTAGGVAGVTVRYPVDADVSEW